MKFNFYTKKILQKSMSFNVCEWKHNVPQQQVQFDTIRSIKCLKVTGLTGPSKIHRQKVEGLGDKKLLLKTLCSLRFCVRPGLTNCNASKSINLKVHQAKQLTSRVWISFTWTILLNFCIFDEILFWGNYVNMHYFISNPLNTCNVNFILHG